MKSGFPIRNRAMCPGRHWATPGGFAITETRFFPRCKVIR
jgi:hypothetical protein